MLQLWNIAQIFQHCIFTRFQKYFNLISLQYSKNISALCPWNIPRMFQCYVFGIFNKYFYVSLFFYYLLQNISKIFQMLNFRNIFQLQKFISEIFQDISIITLLEYLRKHLWNIREIFQCSIVGTSQNILSLHLCNIPIYFKVIFLEYPKNILMLHLRNIPKTFEYQILEIF